jgi:type I restriction enzyme M protein
MKSIKALGFLPKENSTNVYYKKYALHDNYIIEIDLTKMSIDFGLKIFFNDGVKNSQNITKPEDEVVLECIDRLLEQGYSPKNIVLEKRWEAGHGHSGRLDVLVTQDSGSAYMMIECKTWGKEYDKACVKLQKDGGQLFTYFRFDTKAEILVLYSSQFKNNKIEYTNQIIKIEEEYRATSNVKDFYDRWNKLSKNNGVFDIWASAYNYESKALTPKELIDITAEDSSLIFNRFMEILRHNVVSDKPNAFSKIFTLFLCKIMDEKITKANEELGFQWFEGIDTHVSFQKRLTDLYQKGMKEFLDKEVTDLSDNEFEEKFGTLDSSLKQELLAEFTKIRLQKNNEFAIKDVFDQDTFEENAIVVKEVVELLQNYKIRYTKKQQFLSDFFELLLTTGLKQEVGQFFTPVPIAKFIIRSIPFDRVIKDKLEKSVKDELLPNVIDYAVGSGHFITEAMDEIQKNINTISHDDYISDTAKKLKSWKEDHFDWAYDYVYGIEKDYRLVKTAKVGCYLHGDGLAKVIHGDGLSNFTQTKEYKGKLDKRDKNYHQDNKQFDMVLSNPPYSVSAFKNIGKTYNQNDFELYDKLTDQSSEIEALFIERTKQLLKDGGIAGIILPSSILNNSGIYTKAREIIFKYFDIIAITELGSNTFMATGTNTVILFLRRKNNMLHKKVESSVEKLFEGKKDITIHGIENPLQKYLSNVWEELSVEEYLTLTNNTPSEKLLKHEIMQGYMNKFKGTDIQKKKQIVEIEKEKLLYFIMAYSQRITLVKTGEKKEEKKFLGYEFSNRRGSEGIHPTQRAKTIDECTSLYDENSYENNLKANSYIYSAFNGEFREIDKSLKKNISYVDLVDMMSFDRVHFEKNISFNVKKKVKIESKWSIVKLGENIEILDTKRIPLSERDRRSGSYPYYGATGIIDYIDDYIFKEKLILIGEDGAKWGADENSAFIVEGKYWVNNHAHVLKPNRKKLLDKYLVTILNKYDLSTYITGLNVPKLNQGNLKEIKIPLPPKSIQEKIIEEIESLEETKESSLEIIKNLYTEIMVLVSNARGSLVSLKEITLKIGSGSTPRGGESAYKESGITLIRSQNIYDKGMRKKGLVYIDDKQAKKLDNVNVEKNDILFNITGASVTRCCMIENTYLPARVNQHVAIIRTNEKVLSKYVQIVLVSEIYKNKLLEIASGGTSREALTKVQLEEFKIPLPLMEEQEKIVSKIEIIEIKIAEQEKELASLPQQKEAILKKFL